MSFITIRNQIVVDINKIVYVAIVKQKDSLLTLRVMFDADHGFDFPDLELDEAIKTLEKFSSDAASVANVYK